MAFHEKSAWIMTSILLLTGSIFFPTLFAHWQAGQGLPQTSFLVLLVVFQVVLAVVGQIVIALISPTEASAKLDEREKIIIIKAGHYSGLILGLSVLFALSVYLVIPNGDLLFILVSCGFFLSQVGEYLIQIFFYRRGN